MLLRWLDVWRADHHDICVAVVAILLLLVLLRNTASWVRVCGEGYLRRAVMVCVADLVTSMAAFARVVAVDRRCGPLGPR